MGENESGNLGWRAALTPDLQNNEHLTPIKEVKDLAAGYVDITTKYGEAGKKIADYEGKMKEALFIPGDDAADDVKAAFYNKLGRPETPDKYSFKKPEDWPKDLPYDENFEKGFRDFVHKAGITDKSASQMYGWYTGIVREAAKKDLEMRQAALTEGNKAMQAEWKDKFDENSTITARAVKAFGGDDLKKYLDESGLGNNPVLVKTFFNIGRAMMEDKFVEGDPSKPKQAQGRIHYESMEGPKK